MMAAIFLNLEGSEIGIAVVIIFVLEALQSIDDQISDGGHEGFDGALEQIIGHNQGDKQAPGEDAE